MENPGMVRAVLALHKQGFTIVAIAKALNMHIQQVAEIIDEYN